MIDKLVFLIGFITSESNVPWIHGEDDVKKSPKRLNLDVKLFKVVGMAKNFWSTNQLLILVNAKRHIYQYCCLFYRFNYSVNCIDDWNKPLYVK